MMFSVAEEGFDLNLAKGIAKAFCLQYRLLEFVILIGIYRPLVYSLSGEGSKGRDGVSG